MNKLSINMISESEFTVQGHGVHTAYLELTNALKQRDDVDIAVNTFRRRADITHVQTIGPYSLFQMLFNGGKKVISAHVVPASFVGSIAGAKYWLGASRWYLKWLYGRADCVLAVSGSVADELKNSMHLKNRVETFYNTIDMGQYAPSAEGKRSARSTLGIDEKTFVVIGNGQVQPRKRLDTFVAAARALPDVKFIWIGGIPFKHLGADYDAMMSIINSVPANVTVTGVIPLADVRNYLLAGDVFFLPSDQENHPMCVLEAAGARLPIILRDIKEYDDTFRPDAMFIATDEQAIHAIASLRDDHSVYETWQKHSDAIAGRFDSAAGAERAMNVYRSLLG
ncbi:MAG: glycosyltransferase [Candidatus Saccharimonadales bacterium]